VDPLESLTQINLDDLVASFGWQAQPILARALRKAFDRPSRKFAAQMLEFDTAVGERGLVEASRLSLGHYVKDVRVFSDPLPAGPFLALSNHPGMTDTLALFSALERPDLKIIALDRPFLKALPNTSNQLFYLRDDAAARISLVRQVTAHLRAGGAALTFPAGQIEPDPDVYEGAREALQTWTDSAGVFLRMAPETAILPVVVRGVIWVKTASHPLLALRKTRREKEALAAAFQLLSHILWEVKPVTVRVQIGRPIHAGNLGATDTAVVHQAVIAEMKRLVENPPQDEGRSVMRRDAFDH
jgi:1-acyl-sn-glycerol-3-phosphate acyltransferase